MWLPRFRRFRTSDMEDLSHRYLGVLRKRYRLSPDAVSNAPMVELWPEIGEGGRDLDEILEEVASKASGQPLLLNHYWNVLLGHLMEVVDPAFAANVAVFIGEVPDGRFNAMTTGSGRRHLVLVQRGLELFLYRMAFIVVASMRWRLGEPGEGEVVVEPQIDMASAAAEVRANLALLGTGRHRMPPEFPPGPARRFAPFLAYAMQQFVIAHELGHIVQALWRRQPAKTERESTMIARAARLPVPAWREEAICDMFAADLCERLVPASAARFELPEALVRRFVVEAPHIVFLFMQALEAAALLRGRGASTHPPVTERSSILIEHQCAHGLSPEESGRVAERCLHVAELAGSAWR